MGITLNSIGFFFKSWGEDGSFQGRRCIILYFLAFLKKTALQTFTCCFKILFQNNLQTPGRDSQTVLS